MLEPLVMFDARCRSYYIALIHAERRERQIMVLPTFQVIGFGPRAKC